MITFIDLFSGIGGFRAGLEAAGFKCVGHCELDKFADRSYRAIHNVQEEEWYAKDIREVKAGDIPKCDIWTAGFPCQEISAAGTRVGLSGARSGLFFEIIRLLESKSTQDKPRWIILENVRNLFSVNKSRDFNRVLSEISKVGYDCEWEILNSKAFGVPQNRQRVYIIGHLRGRSRRKVFPITRSNKKDIKQLIGGRQGSRVYDPNGVGITLTASGGGKGKGTGLYFIDLTKNPRITENSRCLKARYNAGITNRQGENSGVLLCNKARAVTTPDRKKVRSNGRRIKDYDEPMFTLTTKDRHGIELNGRIRRLTPLECFRLQGFSDEMFYRAQKVNSDTQLYKQAGNTVTVSVIYEIGKKLMQLQKGELNEV